MNIINSGEQSKLIGELGKPLGTTVTVKGTISYKYSKGYESGLNITVQQINDSAIQQLISIPVSPYFGKFGENNLPKLDTGKTYSLRVYETGEFVGTPSNTYTEAGISIQTTGFYFQNKLIVLSGLKINPLQTSPKDYIGQTALISGIAVNENDTATIITADTKLKIIGFRKWFDTELGKPAEIYGLIETTETNTIYVVRNATPRLVKLEDQIGKIIKLRGRAISLNGYWWFNYRGIDIYVEEMEKLPNWNEENHFRAMEISGILEQAMLPRLDQIIIKENRDLKLYYIIRKASWEPIKQLLAVEDVESGD